MKLNLLLIPISDYCSCTWVNLVVDGKVSKREVPAEAM